MVQLPLSWNLESNESSLSPGRMSQHTIEFISCSLLVTFPLAFQVTVSGGTCALQRWMRVDLLSFSVSKLALSFSKLL